MCMKKSNRDPKVYVPASLAELSVENQHPNSDLG